MLTIGETEDGEREFMETVLSAQFFYKPKTTLKTIVH